jgi:hypothetical protein
MSLDVCLEDMRRTEVYQSNVTHNLNTMAMEAGIYQLLWRPDELRITYAGDLIAPLREGLARLRADPDRFKRFNPENGWGSYDDLCTFVAEYLAACESNPDATVRVWR